MEPAINVLLLWLLFGGTHVGLATARVRPALVGRLGERGFLVLFFAVAFVSFGWLVAYYTAHRFEGASGIGLGAEPAARGLLIGVMVAGFALLGPALAYYDRSPMALFAPETLEPRGVERITRHPFFVGFGLVMLAHALLAGRLAGTVFFGGFTILAFAGARHQDRKLLARRGAPYARYLAVTSTVPFAAVLAGRQRLVWREMPLALIAASIALAVVLRLAHDVILAHGGAWFIGAFAVGSLVAAWSSLARGRRTRTRAAAMATPARGGH